MMLWETLALVAFITILIGAFLLFTNAAKTGLCVTLVGVALGVAAVIVQECSDKNATPTALDVYRGKTTLEITYRDSVAIDSTVVYKEEMKWTFWKATEDYIHITPIVAFLNDEEGFYMKFGWLRWRCGFVIYKMK